MKWLKDNWQGVWTYTIASLVTGAFASLAIISGFETSLHNLPGVIAGSLGVFLMMILLFKQIREVKHEQPK